MDIIKLLRPHQWVKNIFIFLPLFFGGYLFNLEDWINSIYAFFAYSFTASSIYCFNDIWDVEADRQHPKKCKRPIASGAIRVPAAYCIMLIMALFSSLICYIGFNGQSYTKVIGVIAFYYIMNIAYCTFLKQKALIDVFIIAIGFVLRVILGGFATGIVLSQWIIIMTFLLALFLAFAKRRDDVVLYEDTGVKMRKNVNRYNLSFMNQAITMVATITMIAYIMYCISPDVASQWNSHYLYLTSIWVLLGILRYMQLTIVDVKSGSPTKVLLKDRFTQLCIFGFIVTFAIIIYL